MNKTFQIHLRIESEWASALAKEAENRKISLSELCREKLMGASSLTKIEFILDSLVKRLEGLS